MLKNVTTRRVFTSYILKVYTYFKQEYEKFITSERLKFIPTEHAILQKESFHCMKKKNLPKILSQEMLFWVMNEENKC